MSMEFSRHCDLTGSRNLSEQTDGRGASMLISSTSEEICPDHMAKRGNSDIFDWFRHIQGVEVVRCRPKNACHPDDSVPIVVHTFAQHSECVLQTVPLDLFPEAPPFASLKRKSPVIPDLRSLFHLLSCSGIFTGSPPDLKSLIPNPTLHTDGFAATLTSNESRAVSSTRMEAALGCTEPASIAYAASLRPQI